MLGERTIEGPGCIWVSVRLKAWAVHLGKRTIEGSGWSFESVRLKALPACPTCMPGVLRAAAACLEWSGGGALLSDQP